MNLTKFTPYSQLHRTCHFRYNPLLYFDVVQVPIDRIASILIQLGGPQEEHEGHDTMLTLYTYTKRDCQTNVYMQFKFDCPLWQAFATLIQPDSHKKDAYFTLSTPVFSFNRGLTNSKMQTHCLVDTLECKRSYLPYNKPRYFCLKHIPSFPQIET